VSVMVYSRLGELLRVKDLSVDELRSRIARRFGLTVDARTLNRWTRGERVRRPDLELAGAAAAVLEVGLDDVFAVEAIPVDDEDQDSAATVVSEEERDDILDPEQSRRLRELYALQGRRLLTTAEWAEMDVLVSEFGRRVYQRGVRVIAERDGRPVEQVETDLAAERDRVSAWYQELRSDPERLEAAIQQARARQQARATG